MKLDVKEINTILQFYNVDININKPLLCILLETL